MVGDIAGAGLVPNAVVAVGQLIDASSFGCFGYIFSAGEGIVEGFEGGVFGELGEEFEILGIFEHAIADLGDGAVVEGEGLDAAEDDNGLVCVDWGGGSVVFDRHCVAVLFFEGEVGSHGQGIVRASFDAATVGDGGFGGARKGDRG